MGYVDNNLMRGETVVHRAIIHWAIFLPFFFWTILGVFVSALGAESDEVFLYVAVVLFLIAIIRLLKAIILRYGSDYAVTNKRIILKKGILSRSVTELMLTKCEGVSMNQPIIGRILGFGTLLITTGGVTNSYRFIRDPKTFRNQINEQIDLAQNLKSSPAE